MPAPCTTDGNCRSRESCVCGLCLVAICDTADECPAGRVCTFDERRCDRACTKDGDCAAGEHCSPGKGVCRGACTDSSNCQAGEQCRIATGQCEIAVCADDTSCSGGRSCQLERVPADVREPAPLLSGSGILLFYERDDVAMGPMIETATSSDGRNFIVQGDLFRGRAPSVAVRPDTSYLMAFEDPASSELWLVQSMAGKPWTRVRDAPIATFARSPSLLELPDGLDVYFDAGGAIMRAHSSDRMRFDDPQTVLAPAAVSDDVLWRDVDALATPWAESLTDPDGQPYIRLWFGGHGVESGDATKLGEIQPTPADWSIGEASSYDGLGFTPYPFEPVFDRTLNFLDHPSELEPAVISFGGQLLMYYRRAAADGSRSEGLAIAHSPADPPKN
jgi:hypothetical protein